MLREVRVKRGPRFRDLPYLARRIDLADDLAPRSNLCLTLLVVNSIGIDALRFWYEKEGCDCS